MINCGAQLQASGLGAGWNETCACLDLLIGCWRAGAAGDRAEQYVGCGTAWIWARCEAADCTCGRCGNDACGECGDDQGAGERRSEFSQHYGALPMVSRDCGLCESASRRGFRAAPDADQRARVLPVGPGGTER